MYQTLKTFLFLFFTAFYTASSFSQTGSVSGHISNIAGKEPLAGAFVYLQKTNFKNAADGSGDYRITGIPAGEYDLVIEFVGYSSITRHIKVKQNETLQVDAALALQGKELQEVYVFGKLSDEEETTSRLTEKKANNILNTIAAKTIEKSPDINAANVLQRMSGVSIQRNSAASEAYAIVRGLEPRYNNTLINGVKIPSPDDKSRFVSLDVVPSDLLQKIEISKSLLPEMEADAIGGTVNLVMKDAPETKTLKATASVGYGKIFLDRKYFSFNNKDIKQKSLHERFGNDYIAKPEDFSRSNLDFTEKTAIPTVIAGVTWGQRFLHRKLGVLIAENFQNQYYGVNSELNQAVPNTYANRPDISDVSIVNYSTQQLNNGLTLHADYKLNEKNKIVVTDVVLYSYLSQARFSVDTAYKGGNGGRTVPGTGPVYTSYTSITDHQFINNLKIEGKHILSKHFLVDWFGVYSIATKRTPDRADLSLNKKIDTVNTNDPHQPYRFISTPQYFDAISRVWQHNKDQDYDGVASLTYRTLLSGANSLELKAGGLYRHKTRYNLQDEYDLKPTTNSTNGIKEVYTDIYSTQWIVYDTKGTAAYDVNNYKLFENITAGYLQLKLSLKSLDIFGGVRTENTHQGYTLNIYYPNAVNAVTKNYTDVLPSVMAKIKLNERTNIRMSYFKSIARPNFYELVPAPIKSNSTATTEIGNPYLRHTVADNYDLRYEFYPSEEGQLFVGGFYKKIKDPIEYAYNDVSTYTPQNLGDATVYGAELVFTKYFGRFGTTGNYTYIYSKISSPKFYTDVSAGTTDPNRLQQRPMQGQTDHTLNISLLYRNEKKGLFVQVAFEYLGKTLARVYPIYGYDYYQRPQSLLAFSGEKQLRKSHFTIFTKFNNLLNTATTDKINGLLTARDVYGASGSVGVRYSK
jgi:TonB-dependent receptor